MKKSKIESWTTFYEKSKCAVEWPKFESDFDAYLHVLGMVSTGWNALEHVFSMYLYSSKIPNGVAQYLSAKQNNNDKIELMKILADEYQKDDPVAYAQSITFFRFASICAENRNYIVHSTYSTTQITPNLIRLTKPHRSKAGQYVNIEISISDLRQMAQDIQNVVQLGARTELVMLKYPDRIAYFSDGTPWHLQLLGQPPKPLRVLDYSI